MALKILERKKLFKLFLEIKIINKKVHQHLNQILEDHHHLDLEDLELKLLLRLIFLINLIKIFQEKIKKILMQRKIKLKNLHLNLKMMILEKLM